MKTADQVIEQLQTSARPDQLDGMARFGLTGARRLGVAVPDMRRIAKAVGRDHGLALALYATGIPEAMMVASMIDVPAEVTDAQMEAWVVDFAAWDVCDQVCMNLFEKTPLAWQKIHDWSTRDEEFVKRAAFALIACLAWHHKTATDDQFVVLIPVIRAGATDERNMVKKAVSWALRNMGKRSPTLRTVALQTAQDLRQIDSRPARWIAADVQRDLARATVRAATPTPGAAVPAE